jgi:hypothetical protein
MKDGEVPNLAGSDSWREQPFRPVIRISLGKRRSMKMVNTRVPRYFAAKSLYYDSRVAAMATAVDDPPNQQPRRTTAQRSAGREAPTTERQVARTVLPLKRTPKTTHTNPSRCKQPASRSHISAPKSSLPSQSLAAFAPQIPKPPIPQ